MSLGIFPGVGLALKGPSGSMKLAVDKMRKYQQWTLVLLEIGLFSFHFSALALTWIQLEQCVIILLTSTLLCGSAGGTAYFIHETKHVFIHETKHVFEIPEGQTVVGSLNRERLMQGMEQHTSSSARQERLPFSQQQQGIQLNGQPMYQSVKNQPQYDGL
jgi:hypothetical protein